MLALTPPPTGAPLCTQCKARPARPHPVAGYWKLCAFCVRAKDRWTKRRLPAHATGRKRRQRKALREDARALVLKALGGVCVCPGCPMHADGLCPVGRLSDTQHMLSVEHTKDDGAVHRRRLKPKRQPGRSSSGGGWIRYLRVLRAGPPDHGMILLCRNCHAEAERRKCATRAS